MIHVAGGTVRPARIHRSDTDRKERDMGISKNQDLRNAILRKDDGTAVPMVLEHGVRIGADGPMDSVEWGIGDKRGKGMNATVTITERAADAAVAIELTDDEENTIVFPILRRDDTWNASGPQGKAFRTAATFHGVHSGVVRTLEFCPTIEERKDGNYSLALRLRLVALDKASASALDF